MTLSKLRPILDGWQVVIGIETHAQIRCRRKLFSNSTTSQSGHPPNSVFNHIDAALPGTLPKLNSECVALAIRAALALNCSIRERSSFDRKHYFYSDLPTGYQITQHYLPFATNGHLYLPTREVPVKIKQIQLEQDTAKQTLQTDTHSLHIDLNRAGMGLLEIVTEPDITSAEEAALYVRELQAVLRAVGVSDGNMELGSFRCDLNISINRPGQQLGTRCEVKNLNSVRFMVGAIAHEIKRQRAILESTDVLNSSNPSFIAQETRGYDPHSGETYRLRSKEDAADYRYMPDPNIGYLNITQNQIQDVRRTLPSLPSESRARLLDKYGPFGVTEDDIQILMNLDPGGDIGYDGEGFLDGEDPVAYFEKISASSKNPKGVMNWIIHTLKGALSSAEKSFKNRPPVTQMVALINLVDIGTLTRPSARVLLQNIIQNPLPETISIWDHAKAMNIIAFASPGPATTAPIRLHELCQFALEAHPSELNAIRAGHLNVVNKLVGWVMKESSGRADAKTARTVILELVKGSNPTT